MLHFILVSIAVFITVNAFPSKLPEPRYVGYKLPEEEFEDNLDIWLKKEEQNWINTSYSAPRSGCSFRINGDLGQPQPVYIHKDTYLSPNENTGRIQLNAGDRIIVSCPGLNRVINHTNIVATVQTANARCVSNTLVSGSGWLNGNGDFGNLTCSNHAYYEAQQTKDRCFNNSIVIRIGFKVNEVFHPLYWSCFDPKRMEVLYVWYNQNPANAVHQSDVDRPNWLAGSFFPGVNINTLYTKNGHKRAIAALVGNDIADRYITTSQFLSRGHLAAKSDFVFATGQRATFMFINAAPQWQLFNARNWNSLEQNLRQRIVTAGYHTVIYTGTYGVSQLRNRNGRLVDIYLHSKNRVPVPLYYYKVVYDSNRRRGTAFVGINNPYYTLAEARELEFCTDRCRSNAAFNWIKWQAERIDFGYSFCCTIPEFKRYIKHIPNFDVGNGLLT